MNSHVNNVNENKQETNIHTIYSQFKPAQFFLFLIKFYAVLGTFFRESPGFYSVSRQFAYTFTIAIVI